MTTIDLQSQAATTPQASSARRPLVSVLMPVYNGERYLRECVDSILAQTVQDFEFCVVDDGSRDGTLAILHDYERRDPRFRIVSRPNKGLTPTLQEVYLMARGEFLARMDCDDVALPDRFEVQLAALRADPSLVCVGGDFEMMDADGRSLTVLRPPHDDATIQRQALGGAGAITHPTAMIRRDAMDRIGGYDLEQKLGEDIDLWLRLGEVGKLGNVPRVVLRYRLHEGSVSETRCIEQRKFSRLACEKAWRRRGITDGKFEAEEPWRPGKDAASRHKFALQYGWWAFNSGHRSTALHYGWKAVRALPFKSTGWKLVLCALLKTPKAKAVAHTTGAAIP